MDYRFILSGIRLWQLLWLILFTALIGNVIANNINAATSATAAINFSMFVAAFAWITVLYAIVGHFFTYAFESLLLQRISLLLELATTLFTFIAAVVLSAKLRAVNCGNLDHRKLPGNYIVWGSANDVKRCREIQASAVFAWFLFIGFVGSLLLVWKQARGHGRASTFRGSSMPSMSQVGSSVA